MFDVKISAIGQVTHVKMDDDSVAAPAWRECATERIRGWQFPTTGSDDDSSIVFSVAFSSD